MPGAWSTACNDVDEAVRRMKNDGEANVPNNHCKKKPENLLDLLSSSVMTLRISIQKSTGI